MPAQHGKILCRIVAAALVLVMCALPVHADRFTFADRDGKEVAVEARLAGSGQDVHALELADGQLLIVPQSVVQKREVADGPQPLSAREVADKLEQRFGKDNIRTFVEEPFVIALVLSGAPKDGADEIRIKGFLRKAHKFFDRVQTTFLTFIRRVRVQVSAPRFPMVVLIFETDRGFEQYTTIVTGNRGLSAQNMAGFYSPTSNYLTLRSSECQSFETPLHESIHQQVYNRGIFQRLAPVPTWFNEGIATGFEGDGERIRNGPMQVSEHYGNLSARAQAVDWREIVRNDRAFRGDVFAGEAYGHAWGLHWLLANQYTTKYQQYIQLLSQKQTLAVEDPDTRLAELEEVVGKPIGELQKEFYGLIIKELRKKNKAAVPNRAAGFGQFAGGASFLDPGDPFLTTLLPASEHSP